jgi:hypothetical protein
MQTPQGLDATHGDQLFPVKRDHIGTNSGAQRASFGGLKLLASRLETARRLEFGISNDLSSEVRWASIRQLLQQRLRLLQVPRVEALREPPVNRSQQFARLLHLALVAPEAREAHGGA